MCVCMCVCIRNQASKQLLRSTCWLILAEQVQIVFVYFKKGQITGEKDPQNYIFHGNISNRKVFKTAIYCGENDN